jgi:UDP-glucose 4-epimerase
MIGEDPQGIPNNLVPYVSQVAIGQRDKLSVFGGDYPTHDGTGVRDFIHVVDLALGHLAALSWMQHNRGIGIWNLGTGRGYSVLEIVHAFEQASGRPVPYTIVERRPGDIAECWADASRAERELGWKAVRGLEEMMANTWRWQSMNPLPDQPIRWLAPAERPVHPCQEADARLHLDVCCRHHLRPGREQGQASTSRVPRLLREDA